MRDGGGHGAGAVIAQPRHKAVDHTARALVTFNQRDLADILGWVAFDQTARTAQGRVARLCRGLIFDDPDNAGAHVDGTLGGGDIKVFGS